MTPQQLAAAADAPTAGAPSTERGAVTWYSSDEDSGPDVGLSMGLGNGEFLWVGELPGKSGWHLAIYHSTAGREDIAQFVDAETARTFFEALEKLAAEAQILADARARQARTIAALEAEARQSALAREAQHREIGRLRSAIAWALGNGDSNFGDYEPKNAPRYWWRGELRRRAALETKP